MSHSDGKVTEILFSRAWQYERTNGTRGIYIGNFGVDVNTARLFLENEMGWPLKSIDSASKSNHAN